MDASAKCGEVSLGAVLVQENLPSLLVGYMKVNADCINVPFLMWSPAKPALLARLSVNALYVYHGSDMTLLDKKPMALEGIQDARWSPTHNLLAIYQVRTPNIQDNLADVM